jgi:dihydroxyacetone kinase phosphoprotein-dependent L subunit
LRCIFTVLSKKCALGVGDRLKNSLTAGDFQKMFINVAQQMIDAEEYLTVIDKKIGDGDHGTSMSLGFKEVQKELLTKEFAHINEVFQCVGMTLLDTMGGASGVLFGTVFISGIVGLDTLAEIDLNGIAGIFQRSLAALKKRGKAQIGDKTMVDAFEPATQALLEAAGNGDSLREGLNGAAKQAEAGKEYTKQCVAKFGRAKSFGQAAIGLEDAGAVSVWIIFKSMAQWVNENYSG